MSTSPTGRAHVPEPSAPGGGASPPRSARRAVPVSASTGERCRHHRHGRAPGWRRRPEAEDQAALGPHRAGRWLSSSRCSPVAVALAAYLYVNHFNSKLSRVDAFSKITGGRPPVLVKGAQNILLLGSDSRDPSKAADLGGWRTDTIILMHVTASHDKAYLISIPRDTWVFVPQSQSTVRRQHECEDQRGVLLGRRPADRGDGRGVHRRPHRSRRADQLRRLRAGHRRARRRRHVRRPDHHLDPPAAPRVHKGNHHFNGAQALDYIRQRKQFANGDFTRVQHQQAFLKAIMDKAASSGTADQSGETERLPQRHVEGDRGRQEFVLGSMALQFRDLRSSDMTFLTSPSAGTWHRGGPERGGTRTRPRRHPSTPL